MDVSSLKELYAQRRQEIKQRLKEFEQVGNSSEEKIFEELCFCLLTPQSKAKICWNAICELKKRNKLFCNYEEIRKYLRGVRFQNNKAKYIEKAREFFTEKNKISIKKFLYNSDEEIREFLVKNLKGLGYKEASHFLRNIGKGKSLAILDRHILRNLKELKVIDKIPKTLTKKKYLEIEEKMREFAKKIEIPLDELDLLFWSKETGEVFK